ncbi:thrombospondin type-1 domain-containing protein 4-like [Penaeus japonicus]|uniref:thrombospondin type-1 domain-containing protein 4-like n=1 Tax=Penaeus japonicus TaxID=27405 RepID=UPI001C711A19|nr:thrombospondin type-1 domain-containing protein 4-like [Penaeus japonicus]
MAAEKAMIESLHRVEVADGAVTVHGGEAGGAVGTDPPDGAVQMVEHVLVRFIVRLPGRSSFERAAWVAALALVLFASIPAGDAQRTYPEEVHRLVVERLRQRGGGAGAWGEWSAWTPCSRSCGGGVSIQSRECLVNPGRQRARARRRVKNDSGGSRCVGLYKRFQLCNVQACPGGYTDFRREQCASFNKTPFNRRFYTWEPYYDTPDSCALNCRAVGLSFYATLNQTVIDGTACGLRGTNKICVAGMCMELGCDGVLGSGKRLDSCGQCGGDNSTCRVIAGIFSRVRMPYGYNNIATLPAGATNITIQHTKPSTNYLALRLQGGDFFINGNWAVNGSGNYAAAGTVFSYQRPEMYQGDKVFAAGPLEQPVDVMLFFQSNNPGIKYEYRLPMSPLGKGTPASVVPGSPQRPRHRDNPLNPFVPGGPAARTPPSGPVNDARSSNGYGNSIYGSQRRKAEEEEKKKKERQGKKQRNKNKQGNKKRKRYEWKVVGFSSCTETCGGGTQTTRVVCVKRKKGNEVPAKHCADHPKPPEETVRCNLRPCPAEWVPEEWGPCSVSCGLGVQTRSLSCKIRLSQGHAVEAAEDTCTEPPTVSRAQVCDLPACNSAPAWKAGEWEPCSAQCGLGTRHRTVTCVTAKGAVPPHLCPSEEKPSNQELCDMGSCATDTWFFSKWEERCSEECGDGVQRRRVHCSGDALDNQVTETSCNHEQRPATTRACTSDRGCGGKWFTGPWGECDSECGPGRRARSVVCVVWSRGQWRITTDVTQCKADPRPDTTQGCTRPCGFEWYTSEWSQCSVSCGSGVQRREVKCLNERQEPALDCISAAKPDTRQPCNTQSCHQEQADESPGNTSVSDQAPQAPADSSSPDEDSERKSSGNVSLAASWRHPHRGAEDPAGDGFQIHRSEGGPPAFEGRAGLQDSSNRGSTLAWASSGGEEEVVRLEQEEEEEEEEEIGVEEEEEEDEDEGTGRPSGRHSVAASGGRRRRPGSSVRPGPPARPGGFPQHRPGRPWRPGPSSGVCIDRMKNCHLVYKARLCRLKYYNKLCCETCTKNQ